MTYTEDHFSACMFNPLIPTNMLKTYPRLGEIVDHDWFRDTETDKGVSEDEMDAIVRYMVLVYDPKSRLVTDERDLNYRKGTAANMAGMNEFGEQFTEQIYTFTHRFFTELAVRFLMRFVKSKEWTAIVVVEACFWESTKKLLEPISGDNSKQELEAVQKKSVIKDEIDKDILRLEKYYKDFFGEDEAFELRAKKNMKPEDAARLAKRI